MVTANQTEMKDKLDNSIATRKGLDWKNTWLGISTLTWSEYSAGIV